ncbi:MAG: NnrS family protein [Rhodovibrionaceae bacterium]|nr:NnrS family protein [Rhodovibrionaceae bacterium]
MTDTILAKLRETTPATPNILRRGFRPFFLAAGLWAFFALTIWVAWNGGEVSLFSSFPPVHWHAHEMIYGFGMAALAGFLLTAIPNWTGRLPYRGWPLAGLVLLWLAGRLATIFSAFIGATAALVIDLAFPVLFTLLVAREIAAGRNWRNLPAVAVVALLTLGNAIMHLEDFGIAWGGPVGLRLGIAALVMLIVLIGGRVTPSFTRNWLVKNGGRKLPASFDQLDKICLGTTLVALAAWVLSNNGTAVGVLATLAAAANLVRLVRWRGLRTLAEPLVFVLHLGYLWVPLSFALLAAAQWHPQIPPTTAIHAFTVGAVGTMILAVMTRATLGHSGRPLKASGDTVFIYMLITLAALCRIAATLWTGSYLPLLATAALGWMGAFGLFTVVYGPMLLAARTDGKPD